MADIRVIRYADANGGHKREHDPAVDSIQFASFKTASYELTDTKLGDLVTTLTSAGDATSLHHHDSRYYREDEFLAISSGSASPILTGADGKIDESFLDIAAIEALIDHGNLLGLADDGHSQYVALDSNFGTRGGVQTLVGDFLVQDPVSATSIANKQYVDAVAQGLRPKGDVEAATTGPLALATDFEAGDIIDGYTLVAGDRILIKDQANQTENGIYVVQATGAPVRSEDQDNSPLAEIVNGVFVPRVLNGTTNGGKAFLITSQGTGADAAHQIGVDNIVWSEFTSATQLTAGNGIEFIGNVIHADLLASGGLKFVGSELAVEPADFAGEGLIDDGADNLAIDWSTAFNDAKAVKASDLSSTANGFGASIIGVEDSAGNFTGTDVESVLAELYDVASAHDRTQYTAGTGGVTAGDLVYFDASGNVVTYSTITDDHYAVGVALSTALATQPVAVSKFDELLTGLTMTGAAADTIMYWDGSGITNVRPSAGNANVYQVGVAQSATSLAVEVRHLFKKIA